MPRSVRPVQIKVGDVVRAIDAVGEAVSITEDLEAWLSRRWSVEKVFEGPTMNLLVRELERGGSMLIVHDLRGLVVDGKGSPVLDHDGYHCEMVGCERVHGACGRLA